MPSSNVTKALMAHKAYQSPMEQTKSEYPQIVNYLSDVARGKVAMGNSPYSYGGGLMQLSNTLNQAQQGNPQDLLNYFGAGAIAKHASPYLFNKFSTEHIGKGEGHQAYGYGLYFAEDPNIQNFYHGKFGGHKYDVEIPDNEISKFIDWDDYLTDQPVIKGMPQKFKDRLEEMLEIYDQPPLEDLTGGQLHQLLNRFASEEPLQNTAGTGENLKKEVADFLKSIGIKGIKYFDAGSRKGVDYMVQGGVQPMAFKTKQQALDHIRKYGGDLSETGRSRNYVVFDDSIINIKNVE